MPQLDAELEALEGLRAHERELDQQLEHARQETGRVRDEARRSADRLKLEAEAELLQELELLRAESAAETERSLATIRDETRRRCEVLRRTAAHNLERVLDWLLDRVAGRD